jgi:hypothetical protein
MDVIKTTDELPATSWTALRLTFASVWRGYAALASRDPSRAINSG